jgi:hypothetical protein
MLLGLAVSALAWAVGFVLFQRYQESYRQLLLSRSAAAAGQSPELLTKFCESLVARADATLSFAQLLLAAIAAGGALAVLKTVMSARDLEEKHDKVIERADRAHDRAEAQLAQAEELVAKGRENLTANEDLVASFSRTVEEAKREVEAALSRVREFVDSEKQRLSAMEGRVTELMERAHERQAQVQQAQQEPIAGTGTMPSRAGTSKDARDSLVSHAQEMLRVGSIAPALEALKTAVAWDLSNDFDDIDSLNTLVALLDSGDQTEDAAKYAAIALERHPEQISAQFNQGVVAMHLGDKEGSTEGKLQYWRAALGALDKVRAIHAEGTPLREVDEGKLWLFAGEVAEKVAGVRPSQANDLCERASAWYWDGVEALQADRTQRARSDIRFWLVNAWNRIGRLKDVTSDALLTAGRGRTDIARRANALPFLLGMPT